MLTDFSKACETKRTEYDEYSKMITDETKTILDTIKLLNDDDALELFKGIEFFKESSY